MKTIYSFIVALCGTAFRGNCQTENLFVAEQIAVPASSSKDFVGLLDANPPLLLSNSHNLKKPYLFTEGSANRTIKSSRYLDIYVGVRALPMRTEKATVVINYPNLNSTGGNFSSSTEVKKSNYAINLDISIQGGRKSAHHFEFGMGGLFGRVLGRFYAEVGYGWNFPLGPVTVRPVLNIASGNLRYHLGYMSKSATYIEVNQTKFYSDVFVSAVTNPLALIPRVDISIPISKLNTIKIFAGYHMTVFRTDPFIQFSGQDQYNEYYSINERINNPNVNFLINSSRVQDLPVDIDGLVFGVGVSFNYLYRRFNWQH
ncbi:hypothetical protein EXU57_23220 [Segetibacter sp. 3557_3]|uniref:hypothetical protein n=1 Tax=Segetibacter sp. 3557_3 TaxID=2547429 RepID=UPI001058694C|nr:hypothetical protein [Segetibacter sp. 3557_3]TDH18511.1 hypothetical protein EXU57_23220 [Segetibacter sp. 3557_3]